MMPMRGSFATKGTSNMVAACGASAAASALARLAPTAVNPLTRKNSLRLHSLVFIGSSLFITPRLRKENYASLLCNTIAFDPQP